MPSAINYSKERPRPPLQDSAHRQAGSRANSASRPSGSCPASYRHRDLVSSGMFLTSDTSHSRKGERIGTERALSPSARRILILRSLTGGSLDCLRQGLAESRRACSMEDVMK